MIEIEKGVPLPPRTRTPGSGRPPIIGREAVEAMAKMEVGDSIKIPMVSKNTLYVFLSRERRRTKMRFRFVADGGQYRLWRIE